MVVKKVKSILTADQKKVLDLVRQTKEINSIFYLTGGTVLAEYYLKHRYSDDLDFFTEIKDFPQYEVEAFTTEIKKVIKAKTIDYRRLHDRRIFFFKKDKGELKVEFTYYPFPRLEVQSAVKGLIVDSLKDIAVNKLMTIADRIEAKDFVDLYFIVKGESITLKEITKLVEKKFQINFSPIALGSNFARVKTLPELPRMIKKVSLEKLKEFFAGEAKRLAPEIFR